MADPSLRLVV